jgi:hypothetical protein
LNLKTPVWKRVKFITVRPTASQAQIPSHLVEIPLAMRMTVSMRTVWRKRRKIGRRAQKKTTTLMTRPVVGTGRKAVLWIPRLKKGKPHKGGKYTILAT